MLITQLFITVLVECLADQKNYKLTALEKDLQSLYNSEWIVKFHTSRRKMHSFKRHGHHG